MILMALLEKQVEKTMHSGRWRHTQGVVGASRELARRFGADEEKAALAALLHDIAKSQGKEALYQQLKDTPYEGYLLESPPIWHAPAGALMARDQFGITDQEILDAIQYHTTGRPGMGLVEAIVFLADYMEPGRTQPGVEQIRQLATTNLEGAIAGALRATVSYLESQTAKVHPDTLAALDYYEGLAGK